MKFSNAWFASQIGRGEEVHPGASGNLAQEANDC